MKLKIELNDWITPNFVIQKTAPGKRQDGIKEPMKFAIADLDELTLSELCNNFRAEIFQKAGKSDPLIPK